MLAGEFARQVPGQFRPVQVGTVRQEGTMVRKRGQGPGDQRPGPTAV